jgi:hypothetical protein
MPNCLSSCRKQGGSGVSKGMLFCPLRRAARIVCSTSRIQRNLSKDGSSDNVSRAVRHRVAPAGLGDVGKSGTTAAYIFPSLVYMVLVLWGGCLRAVSM